MLDMVEGWRLLARPQSLFAKVRFYAESRFFFFFFFSGACRSPHPWCYVAMICATL